MVALPGDNRARPAPPVMNFFFSFKRPGFAGPRRYRCADIGSSPSAPLSPALALLSVSSWTSDITLANGAVCHRSPPKARNDDRRKECSRATWTRDRSSGQWW